MVRRKQMLAVVLTAVMTTGLCTVSGLAEEKKVELRRDYNVKPVPFNEVHVNDDFWTPRL